jgi:hypothetical protein
MASNGEVDVRGEVVDLLIEKIASDRNSSVTMMNLVEELLAPDDVPAYVGVLMDKVKSERFPSLAMIRNVVKAPGSPRRDFRLSRVAVALPAVALLITRGARDRTAGRAPRLKPLHARGKGRLRGSSGASRGGARPYFAGPRGSPNP